MPYFPAPQIMTPAMQQYMQEQFLLQLQALQRSQMQQQQQHQERQQQQQMQQQQLQEMRAIQEIMDESGQQKGSPDQGLALLLSLAEYLYNITSQYEVL